MAENGLHLNISSPEKELYDGEVLSVSLPGMAGSFSILPHHAPIVSSLKGGTVSYVTADGHENHIDVQGGFIEMSNNVVSVCIS